MVQFIYLYSEMFAFKLEVDEAWDPKDMTTPCVKL